MYIVIHCFDACKTFVEGIVTCKEMLLRYLDIKHVKPDLLQLIQNHVSCPRQKEQLEALLQVHVGLAKTGNELQTAVIALLLSAHDAQHCICKLLTLTCMLLYFQGALRTEGIFVTEGGN